MKLVGKSKLAIKNPLKALALRGFWYINRSCFVAGTLDILSLFPGFLVKPHNAQEDG